MNREETLHSAKADLELAYKLARKAHYEDGILQCCRELGRYYLSLSDNANSTLYFYLLLKESETKNDQFLVAEAYLGLGLVMYNMSKWKDALNDFNKAEDVLYTIDSAHSNLKLTTYLKGLCLSNLKFYAAASQLLKKSLAYAEETGDSMRMFESRLALIRIAIQDKVDEEVYVELDRMQRFFENRKETIGICYSLQGKAVAYLHDDQPDLAYSYATRALELARTLNLIYPISEVLTTLIETEKRRGHFRSAFTFQEELNFLKDSTNSIEVATQIAMLGASHQFEKKEAAYDAELEAKSKQQRFILILLIATFLVAIVIVYMLRLVALQRRKSDRLLRNILPRQTITELRDQGRSIPKAHENVTIVFADVVKFTLLATTLKPDVLVRILDRYFIQFDAVIKKYNLEKIKTIGDAYMFVSGLEPNPKSVHDAAHACLDMIQAVDKIRAEVEAEYGTSFDFRFGMHTGNVVSGVVGDIKYAFDIWGDAVNIAARMEEHSEPGKINVSHQTHELLQDEFDFKSRGRFGIKNRGFIEMYYLEGRK